MFRRSLLFRKPVLVLSSIFLGLLAHIHLVESPTAPSVYIPVVESVQKVEAEMTETVGIPSRIVIPSIDVDAYVEQLGLLPDGKLDVPKKRENAGWYNLGPRPGEAGNSVIDGHLNTDDGPGVFWDLHKIEVGDIVSVIDEKSVVRMFKVLEKVVYPVNDAPMLDIFGDADGAHLNLITCAGKWNTALDHYEDRLVIYADLVEGQP